MIMIMMMMTMCRCVDDDGYGVGEALQEEAYGVGLVARGQHFLYTGTTTGARLLQQEKVFTIKITVIPNDNDNDVKVLTPQLFFLATDLGLDQWIEAGLRPYSGIIGDKLPDHVQVRSGSESVDTGETLIMWSFRF